jgi:hypothetical protein
MRRLLLACLALLVALPAVALTPQQIQTQTLLCLLRQAKVQMQVTEQQFPAGTFGDVMLNQPATDIRAAETAVTSVWEVVLGQGALTCSSVCVTTSTLPTTTTTTTTSTTTVTTTTTTTHTTLAPTTTTTTTTSTTTTTT